MSPAGPAPTTQTWHSVEGSTALFSCDKSATTAFAPSSSTGCRRISVSCAVSACCCPSPCGRSAPATIPGAMTIGGCGIRSPVFLGESFDPCVQSGCLRKETQVPFFCLIRNLKSADQCLNNDFQSTSPAIRVTSKASEPINLYSSLFARETVPVSLNLTMSEQK